MHLARVTGAVVSTQKSPSLNGKKPAAGAPGKRGRRSSDSPHERR